MEINEGEDYFCIDSKQIEVCRLSRSKRCSMGKKDLKKVPSIGYYASQNVYYYGYELHLICGFGGVFYSFDLTKVSVHDIYFLKDVNGDYSHCTKGYISAQVQLDLYETVNIRLEVPYEAIRKKGNLHFRLLPKQDKELKPYSHNYVTNS